LTALPVQAETMHQGVSYDIEVETSHT